MARRDQLPSYTMYNKVTHIMFNFDEILYVGAFMKYNMKQNNALRLKVAFQVDHLFQNDISENDTCKAVQNKYKFFM